MADPDIVVRLRQGWLAHWDTDVRFVMVYASEWVRLTNLTTESADEIERLRKECFHLAANQCHAGYGGEYGHHRCAEIDRITAERDEARHGEAVATATLYGMIEERTALRAERDEARREVCVLMQRTGFLRGDYAAERNWDCFDRTVNGIDANEIRVDLAGGNQ